MRVKNACIMFCLLVGNTKSTVCDQDPYHLRLDKIRQEIFSCIYKVNAWLDPETRSGPGSNIKQTTIIRTALPALLQQLKITSLLDAPCGDFYWMEKTDLSSLTYYIGCDIVHDIIIQARKKYQNPERAFMCVDIVSDKLPYADAILCRDCLPHLTFADIKTTLKNFKRTGALYLITSTYPLRTQNEDLSMSQELNLWRYRPLNLQVEPFNFPEPLCIINEGNSEGAGSIKDKSLGVWLLKEIPDYE